MHGIGAYPGLIDRRDTADWPTCRMPDTLAWQAMPRRGGHRRRDRQLGRGRGCRPGGLLCGWPEVWDRSPGRRAADRWRMVGVPEVLCPVHDGAPAVPAEPFSAPRGHRGAKARVGQRASDRHPGRRQGQDDRAAGRQERVAADDRPPRGPDLAAAGPAVCPGAVAAYPVRRKGRLGRPGAVPIVLVAAGPAVALVAAGMVLIRVAPGREGRAGGAAGRWAGCSDSRHASSLTWRGASASSPRRAAPRF